MIPSSGCGSSHSQPLRPPSTRRPWRSAWHSSHTCSSRCSRRRCGIQSWRTGFGATWDGWGSWGSSTLRAPGLCTCSAGAARSYRRGGLAPASVASAAWMTRRLPSSQCWSGARTTRRTSPWRFSWVIKRRRPPTPAPPKSSTRRTSWMTRTTTQNRRRPTIRAGITGACSIWAGAFSTVTSRGRRGRVRTPSASSSAQLTGCGRGRRALGTTSLSRRRRSGAIRLSGS
mmetsp:Transcript_2069/g.7378  ORF Transcript_2069/g.7378 Transcript_2069/m.7378 type:complete len:229 (+) Transcript_2069:378-1064(+)